MTFPPIGTQVTCHTLAHPTGFICSGQENYYRKTWVKLWTSYPTTPFQATVTGVAKRFEGYTLTATGWDDPATFTPHHAVYFLAVRKTPTSREQLVAAWTL
jgi:hypothetical protein